MALKDTLGWNQRPEDWKRFLYLSPQGCFKAEWGAELVGTAAAFVFDRVCWIGMVIVKETHRRRGVGRALMRRCLEHSRQAACSLVLLDSTREGLPLYRSFGFQPEQLIGTVRGTPYRSPEGPERERNAQAAGTAPALRVRGIESRDLERLVGLEAAAYGAVREALLYRLVREDPGGGLLCEGEAGQIHGFLLRRPGRHFTQVGPLIARGDGEAEALLRRAFSELTAECPEAAVTLTVPMNRAGMVRALRRHGLEPEPRLTRMVLGGKRLHGREEMVYALSGPEKG